jgi:hypothetical protein
MKRTKTILNVLALASGMLLATGAAHAGMVPEVWMGGGNYVDIMRYDFAGNLLGSIATPTYIEALTVVGNELWQGDGSGRTVRRLDFNGNTLGSFDTPGWGAMDAIAVVGNQVWMGGGY